MLEHIRFHCFVLASYLSPGHKRKHVFSEKNMCFRNNLFVFQWILTSCRRNIKTERNGKEMAGCVLHAFDTAGITLIYIYIYIS
jgi:hypothetical protein